MKEYLSQSGKKPTESLRKTIARCKIDRSRFERMMSAHRIPREDWHLFLPAGGVPGIDYPGEARLDAGREFVWFPHPDHLAGSTSSPLTWAGAGPNDFIESVPSPDPRGGPPIPTVPLDRDGLEPALRLHFRHRVTGVDPEDSWWSAVVGCRAGARAPEWLTVDLTAYDRLKVFVRAYTDPARKGVLDTPVPLYLRFEDDNVDVPGRCLHRSSSWCRPPINVTQWSRPDWTSLVYDFDWGPNAFWPASPPVDQSNILQITFGMDGDVPDCEGVIEIQRIELHGPAGSKELKGS